MAKSIKSNMERHHLNGELLDRLFEVHLRPLRSRMARAIYRVFLENRQYPYLTTLEIQEELARRGIELDKREINAWLKGLLKAGLIERGERRRPARKDYRGRYTYLTWRLTSLGERIAKRISLLIEERTTPTLTQLNGEETQRLLKLSLTLRILKALHLKDGWINLRDLLGQVNTEREEVEKAINRCIEELGVIEAREAGGTLSRILRLLGIRQREFRLTEGGREIAERLFEASKEG